MFNGVKTFLKDVHLSFIFSKYKKEKYNQKTSFTLPSWIFSVKNVGNLITKILLGHIHVKGLKR
jgi:hypothetical protein